MPADEPAPIRPPLASVALATFNGAKFLPELLASLSAQSYSNIEIVVSDDRSTDATVEIVCEFRERPVHFVSNEGLGGVAPNFGNAIAHCRGDYVILADQDDVWLPHKVERLLAAARDVESDSEPNTPVLAFSDLRIVDAELRELRPSFFDGKAPEVAGLSLRDFVLGNRVPGCAMLLNRALADLAMPIPGDIAVHDWWFILVAAALGRIAAVPELLICYRQHGTNTLGAPSAIPSIQARLLGYFRRPSEKLRSRREFASQMAPAIRDAGAALLDRYGDRLKSSDRSDLEVLVSGSVAKRFRKFGRARSPYAFGSRALVLYEIGRGQG